MAAMTIAALTTVCAKTVVSFAANGMNFEKIFKDVFSSDTLKAAAFNALLAGVTHGLVKKFQLQDKMHIISRNAVKFTVNTDFNMALKGEHFQDALLSGVTNFAADVFGEFALGKIGDEFKNIKGDRTLIQNLIHKGLHGVVGAIKGLIKNRKQGAIS